MWTRGAAEIQVSTIFYFEKLYNNYNIVGYGMITDLQASQTKASW